MKRRLYAILMATALVCAGSLVATAAEETEVETEEAAEAGEAVTLNWADFEEQINASEEATAAYAGEFVEFEGTGMKMLIPAAFTEAELTDDDKEAGYVGYYELVNGEGEVGGTIAVQLWQMDEGYTLEDYKELLSTSEDFTLSELYDANINDVEAILYTFVDDEDIETSVVSYMLEDDLLLEIAFNPTNDEQMGGLATTLAASIQEA